MPDEQPERVVSPASHGARRDGFPALRLARPVAALAIFAAVLGRAVAPAFGGIMVGLDRMVDDVKRAGDALTQLFGMCAVAVAASMLLAVVVSRAPAWLRGLAIVLGGGVLLLDVSAAATHVSAASMAMMGAAAASLAIAAGIHALRSPVTRGAGVVLAAVGAAGLIRLAGVAFAFGSGAAASIRLAAVARGFVTAAIAVDLIALGVSTAFVAARGKRLASPVTIVLLGVALVVTRQAIAGAGEDAGPWSLLALRVVDRLAPRPESYFPHAFVAFVTVLGPLVAVAAITSRRWIPTLGAAVSLAVLVGVSPEIPLNAVTLVIAALTLALAVHDQRGLWAALASVKTGDDADSSGTPPSQLPRIDTRPPVH